MSKQKAFTKEFEEEAVRLALTSGRTRRELAENLGVGLSTLNGGSAGAATARLISPTRGERKMLPKS